MSKAITAVTTAINWLKDKTVAAVDWVAGHPWWASAIIVGLAASNIRSLVV